MESISIHPGVKSGKRIYPLAHTSKPQKSKGGKLGKKRQRLNQRQLARDSTLKMVKTPMAAEAFRQPGSMNQHKR